MITGMTTASISRLATGRTKMYVDVPIAAELDYYLPHYRIIKYLRNVPAISGMGQITGMDKQYMGILKKIGADLSDVKEFYGDVPPSEIRNFWTYSQNNDLSGFNFNLLKLENSDIQILKTMLRL